MSAMDYFSPGAMKLSLVGSRLEMSRASYISLGRNSLRKFPMAPGFEKYFLAIKSCGLSTFFVFIEGE